MEETNGGLRMYCGNDIDRGSGGAWTERRSRWKRVKGCIGNEVHTGDDERDKLRKIVEERAPESRKMSAGSYWYDACTIRYVVG